MKAAKKRLICWAQKLQVADMANIKAFSALRAVKNEPEALLDLKAILEPKSDYNGSMDPFLSDFKKLLKNGTLKKEEIPAIYIYENSSQYGTQRGIWTLTHIHDHTINKIVKHEQTLAEHEDKIKLYREQIGLEGNPILLTYRPSAELNLFIAQTIKVKQPSCYFNNGEQHRLWTISEPLIIEQIQRVFAGLSKIYVADGHHRLAAAVGLRTTHQHLISTLYMSTDQLRIREFNRLVIPAEEIKMEDLFQVIYRNFNVSAIPGNEPYRPEQRHHIGMCFKGKWYQLRLKSEQYQLEKELDVIILQEHILNPFFKITDPRQDQRLKNYDPVKSWEKMILENKENPSSVAFTLFPMAVDELLNAADEQKALPPKSTWIEPKIPYGLLIYHSGTGLLVEELPPAHR